MAMQQTSLANSTLARAADFTRGIALRAVDFARAWKHRRDLQVLATFDDRMLRDIGLTRGDLRDAAAEPVWRDPTAVLVTRARERRFNRRPLWRPMAQSEHVKAPPLAPSVDEWSASFFPARSRYY